MVDWLWVPDSQRLVARNWNLARSVSPFTASRVANRVAVSTPLRTALSVVVMDSLLIRGRSGAADSRPVEVRRAAPVAHPCPARICDTRAQHGGRGGDTGRRDEGGSGRERRGDGTRGRGPCPDRPAPDERADRRGPCHLA